MLHQFTWQQFLIAALVFVLVWYLVIFLLYYRGKITSLFAGRKAQQTDKIRREWEEELEDEDPENEDDDLIGRKQLPEGVSEVEIQMLGFAPKAKKADAEPDADDYRDMELGIVPDVLEELKSIFHILETQDGNKEDFISLFALIKAKYPKIRNTPNQEAINDYIRENLPFSISEKDLDLLWI
jgi:hypothetical protein